MEWKTLVKKYWQFMSFPLHLYREWLWFCFTRCSCHLNLKCKTFTVTIQIHIVNIHSCHCIKSSGGRAVHENCLIRECYSFHCWCCPSAMCHITVFMSSFKKPHINLAFCIIRVDHIINKIQ